MGTLKLMLDAHRSLTPMNHISLDTAAHWAWGGSHSIKIWRLRPEMLTRESQSQFPTPNPKDKTSMIILALDLGKFNTMCCVFNTTTPNTNSSTPQPSETTSPLLKKTKCDLVVMEACGPCGWINDLANSLGHKTLVCSKRHPNRSA